MLNYSLQSLHITTHIFVSLNEQRMFPNKNFFILQQQWIRGRTGECVGGMKSRLNLLALVLSNKSRFASLDGEPHCVFHICTIPWDALIVCIIVILQFILLSHDHHQQPTQTTAGNLCVYWNQPLSVWGSAQQRKNNNQDHNHCSLVEWNKFTFRGGEALLRCMSSRV